MVVRAQCLERTPELRGRISGVRCQRTPCRISRRARNAHTRLASGGRPKGLASTHWRPMQLILPVGCEDGIFG
jgi:hypothetical protein